MFYEHVETRISSLGYIKLKRLDNDIKTKSILKICKNYETKENPRQNATSRYRTCIIKLSAHGAQQSNAYNTRHRTIHIRKRYNLYITS